MFVSIDMDKLVFLHKHHDHETLSGLAWLEAPNRSITIENTDRGAFLNKMTQLDLCILYKNATGAQIANGNDTIKMRFQLATLVDNMPATLALAEEVAAQVAAVETDLHNGIAYSYVLGSKVPGQARELFPVQAKPLSDKQTEDAAQRANTALSAPPPPPPARPVREGPTPAVRAPKGAPRPSVRPVIRAAADKAWEAGGKPTDAAQLKAMCASIIPALEAEGYHPTTIRIKLSEWSKEKSA